MHMQRIARKEAHPRNELHSRFLPKLWRGVYSRYAWPESYGH